MAFDFSQVIKGVRDHKKIFLFYGVPGIGKSTQCSALPNAFFVPIEDGTADLDVAQYVFEDGRVKLKTFEEVRGVLEMVYNNGMAAKESGEQFPIENLIIDSVSALEPVIHDLVCAEGDEKGNVKKSIEDFGYGGGYKRAVKKWQMFFDMVEQIRTDLGINVWLIGHSQIKSVSTPENEPFDRYIPELHKDAVGLLQKNCDAIFFANFKTVIRKVDGKMGNKENKGFGTGERVMYTTDMPAHMAKNRSQPSLPPEMPMDVNLALSIWNKKD